MMIGGGGTGGGSAMGQYAWYARVIQDEIREAISKHLNQNGGIPKGKLEAVIKIVLDDKGSIIRLEIMNSSGDRKMDDAVKSTVKGMMISQRPPDGNAACSEPQSSYPGVNKHNRLQSGGRKVPCGGVQV